MRIKRKLARVPASIATMPKLSLMCRSSNLNKSMQEVRKSDYKLRINGTKSRQQNGKKVPKIKEWNKALNKQKEIIALMDARERALI